MGLLTILVLTGFTANVSMSFCLLFVEASFGSVGRSLFTGRFTTCVSVTPCFPFVSLELPPPYAVVVVVVELKTDELLEAGSSDGFQLPPADVNPEPANGGFLTPPKKASMGPGRP